MRPMKTVYEITFSKTGSDASLVVTTEGPNAAAGFVKDWMDGHISELHPANSTVSIKAIEIEA